MAWQKRQCVLVAILVGLVCYGLLWHGVFLVWQRVGIGGWNPVSGHHSLVWLVGLVWYGKRAGALVQCWEGGGGIQCLEIIVWFGE